ncbi:MAG: hypothetical protein ACRCU2_00755, partial [Planktothrix sp.]
MAKQRKAFLDVERFSFGWDLFSSLRPEFTKAFIAYELFGIKMDLKASFLIQREKLLTAWFVVEINFDGSLFKALENQEDDITKVGNILCSLLYYGVKNNLPKNFVKPISTIRITWIINQKNKDIACDSREIAWEDFDDSGEGLLGRILTPVGPSEDFPLQPTFTPTLIYNSPSFAEWE